MKIIFDRIVSFLSLVLLMPIFLLLGIVIYFDLGLPIFFRQKRPGLNGDPFVFFKFRTMLDEKDKEGNFLSEENRITKLGRFLRGLSLDELPSIINVLKGDMSFVGPRPLLMEYLPLYSKDQFSRHNVKPGITGWAQINGRNSISWEEKFQLDLWYIKNHSFSLDLKILFLTLWKVFIRDGINSSENISMRPFLGSDEK